MPFAQSTTRCCEVTHHLPFTVDNFVLCPFFVMMLCQGHKYKKSCLQTKRLSNDSLFVNESLYYYLRLNPKSVIEEPEPPKYFPKIKSTYSSISKFIIFANSCELFCMLLSPVTLSKLIV